MDIRAQLAVAEEKAKWEKALLDQRTMGQRALRDGANDWEEVDEVSSDFEVEDDADEGGGQNDGEEADVRRNGSSAGMGQ